MAVHERCEGVALNERDYVQRVIERLARFIARVAGFRAQEEHEQALRACDDAVADLLGLELGLIESVDAATASRLLGSRDRVDLLARILGEKVQVLRGLGRAPEADAIEQRLAAIVQAATPGR